MVVIECSGSPYCVSNESVVTVLSALVATVSVFSPLNGLDVMFVFVTVAPVKPYTFSVTECNGVPYCVSNESIVTVLSALVATVSVFSPLNGLDVMFVFVTVAPVKPYTFSVTECNGVPYCVSNESVVTVLMALVATVNVFNPLNELDVMFVFVTVAPVKP